MTTARTIRLEKDFARSSRSSRGKRYVTGLSCAAYLVSLGHDPIDIVTKPDGKHAFAFANTAQVRDDGARYVRATQELRQRTDSSNG